MLILEGIINSALNNLEKIDNFLNPKFNQYVEAHLIFSYLAETKLTAEAKVGVIVALKAEIKDQERNCTRIHNKAYSWGALIR